MTEAPTDAPDPGSQAVIEAFRKAGRLDLLRTLAEALHHHNATAETRAADLDKP